MKVNNQDYQVKQTLGKGKSGYSYLVSDGINDYVLKQIHHEPCEYYTFGNKLESEIQDYQKLISIGIPLPKLIDVDVKNERILKEYIQGDTIFEKIIKDEMKDIYFQQINQMCEILYQKNLNIDYFPTNFVIQEETMYYIDYECNNYMEEWNFENWGIKYWSKTKEFIHYLNDHILGQSIHVIIDRPKGSPHPKYNEMIYPINYGYVKGIYAPDQEEQDVYVLGVDHAIQEFDGKVIAVIHRKDDVEDKWVVASENQSYTKEEIEKQVFFCEQYFDYEIEMESERKNP